MQMQRLEIYGPRNVRAFEVSMRTARAQDMGGILRLVNAEHERSGAVLRITEEELKRWIDRRLSVVALAGDKIVGHQALDIWPGSRWAELRSEVVLPEHRGLNISRALKGIVIGRCVMEHPYVPAVVSLKNGMSNGTTMLFALGFKPMESREVPNELFSIGTGQEWKAYVMSRQDAKIGLFAGPMRR